MKKLFVFVAAMALVGAPAAFAGSDCPTKAQAKSSCNAGGCSSKATAKKDAKGSKTVAKAGAKGGATTLAQR